MDNEKKRKQLGMPFGTACGRLRKQIVFHLLQRLGEATCYRCKQSIERCDDLSIEHKLPWLNAADPVGVFFDLSNVAFSHLACNSGDARRPNRKYFTEADRLDANRRIGREGMKRRYSTEGRRQKYLLTGH